MVYPVYMIFLIISISGIPVAISKLISEQTALGNYAGARRIFNLATTILFVAGFLFSALLYFAAPFIATWIIRDPGTALPLRALSPAVLLLSLTAAFRGFYQGVQEMRPNAFVQIVEQAVRVVIMIYLALLLMGRGVEWAATGAALGTVFGGALGLLLLALYYLWKGHRLLSPEVVAPKRAMRPPSTRMIIRRIYQLALPIVFGTLISPVSQSLDALIVPRQLQSIGYPLEMARALYGQLTGMAMSLVHFPCVLTIGLAMALVPAVSESLAKRENRVLRDRIDNSLWLSVAVGLPSSVGLFLLAEPLSNLLFKIPEVAVPLKAAALGTIFIALAETSIAVLQGLGQVVDPVRYLFYGAVAKVGLSFYLTGRPEFGIKGAAAATVVAFAIPALLNFKALHKHAGYIPRIGQLFLKPGLAAGLMGLSIAKLYPLLELWSVYLFSAINLGFTVGLSVVAAVAVYLLALIAIGGIPPRFSQLLAASRSRILHA